ncbi:Ca2+-binding RTX toxin-like protein [Limimaricola variabilis]|uniref:Ca2+-binding RTX toxin-like protein n=1 Tax=Limimaricola variabilis TaxID=1492771 RepID=A0ABR6HJS9_9RHOB|nr:Hint domain-containing protein [Limimaricola variabilis]MBB3710815.1 Ca2+-binding RTX toxin-like protein [Limimaricola variabilis]
MAGKRFDGTPGNDTYYGGDGNDEIFGGAGNDKLYGNAGDDWMDGGEGCDEVHGGDGNDHLTGDAYDTLYGGDGADTFKPGRGGVVYGGGDGSLGDVDTLDLRGMGNLYAKDIEPDGDGNGSNGWIQFLDEDMKPTGEKLYFYNIEKFLKDNQGDNRAPVARDDSASTERDMAINIDVLANDSDPDGDSLRVSEVWADHGEVYVDEDGSLRYTPEPGFTGDVTISYKVTDDRGGFDDATVALRVQCPTGPDGIVEGTMGDDLIDLAYDGDPEGDRVDNGDAILGDDAPDDDRIEAYGGDDTVKAGKGDDLVYGGAGNDTIYGEDGDDDLYGDGGRDTLYGGAGNDRLDGGTGGDELYGGSGDDELIGSRNGDKLFGGEGDDKIDGGAENDVILGGTGNDVIHGGDGNDRIDSSDGDREADLDRFDNPYPGLGRDADPYDDRDTVYGGAGDDIIHTGDDRDTIFGGTGNDRIDGGIDDDLILGEEGDDTLTGGEGNDTVFGGDGDDVIRGGLDPRFPDSLNIRDDRGDRVTDNGRDELFGGKGNDTILGQDDDDTIFGGDGDDYLDGGIDDDTIFGGAGDDRIIGGQGNDLLFGDDDRDYFVGGNGGDRVIGGEGGDDYDTLDLSGTDVDRIEYTSDDREDGIVYFKDGTTLRFEEIENVVPCFTPGTVIATPRGERLVEELREGDRIITRDNGIQEIRWVGHKQVGPAQFLTSPHLKPVMIRAGALGNGLPERDMMVSPNHRVLLTGDRAQLYFEDSEVLAAAKHLVGSKGIHSIDVSRTSYIHFMFDRHEVVLSNGAWTESFQPGDHTLKGIGAEQRDEIFELFPELRQRAGIDNYRAARKALKRHEARLMVV